MSRSEDLPPPPRTRVRSGAHRGKRSLVQAVLPSVLAVAAVSALITALTVWQNEEPRGTSSAVAATTQESHGSTAGPAADATTPEASKAPATDTPPSPSASAAAPSNAAASSSSAPSSAEPEAARTIEVVVLNQTSRSGLASRVAETLRADGWTVPAVGNFRGVVPATTVYYPPGAEAQALAAAQDLPTAPRIKPRFGNLSTSRLTVVVTDSYPG